MHGRERQRRRCDHQTKRWRGKDNRRWRRRDQHSRLWHHDNRGRRRGDQHDFRRHGNRRCSHRDRRNWCNNRRRRSNRLRSRYRANPERGRCHVDRWWRHVDRRRHDDRRSNKYAGAPDTTPTPATAPTTVMNVPAANPTEATTALTTAPALMASAIVPAPIAPAVVPAMPSSRIRAGMHRHEPGCQRKHRRGPDDAAMRRFALTICTASANPSLPPTWWWGYGKTVVWHSGNSQFAMTRPGSKLCCTGSAGNEPDRSDPFAPPLIGVTRFGL